MAQGFSPLPGNPTSFLGTPPPPAANPYADLAPPSRGQQQPSGNPYADLAPPQPLGNRILSGIGSGLYGAVGGNQFDDLMNVINGKTGTLTDRILASPEARFAKGLALNPLTGTAHFLQSPVGHMALPFSDPVGTAGDLAGTLYPGNPFSTQVNANRDQMNNAINAINQRVVDARKAVNPQDTGLDLPQTTGDVASAFLPMPGGKTNLVGRFAPDVEKLIAEGITPTVGQAATGAANRIEQGITSIPVLGDLVNAARGRTTEDLNRAAYNRVLAPLQQAFPDAMAVGRKAVDYLHGKISDAYDTAINGAQATNDPIFQKKLQDVIDDAGDFIPDKVKVIQGFIDKRITPLFQQNSGVLPGDVYKTIDARLRGLSDKFGGSTNTDDQLIGDAFDGIREAMMDSAARANPQAADQIKAANAAYANYVRVSRAAGMTGSKAGVFSAEGLQSAVRGADTSVRRDLFSRGGSLLQDLSDPAVNVLGKTVPDSGTAGRWMIEHPVQAAILNVVGLPLRPLYSKTGQAAVLNAARWLPNLPGAMARGGAKMGAAFDQPQPPAAPSASTMPQPLPFSLGGIQNNLAGQY